MALDVIVWSRDTAAYANIRRRWELDMTYRRTPRGAGSRACGPRLLDCTVLADPYLGHAASRHVHRRPSVDRL